MSNTSWPFVEWNEIIGSKGPEKLHVFEEVVVGKDAAKLGFGIRKVAIFSTRFKPSALSVKGDKLVGILAENRKGEYFYSAFFERVRDGETKRFEVTVRSKPTVNRMEKNGYHSNFAWSAKHVQRIVFRRGTTILSAVPKGYEIETFEGKPCIVWRRDSKYWGDIQVKIASPSSTP